MSPRALRRYVLIAFAVLLALMPQLPVPEFWITQANYIGLYTLVALGLVLLTGIAGLTSFGQAAFVGLGAYTAAYLTLTYGVSPWLTVWIGLVVTGVAALGALFVGLIESFGSFWASAFKEVIVFTLIIPVLLWRSFQHGHHDDEE